MVCFLSIFSRLLNIFLERRSVILKGIAPQDTRP